MMVEVEADGREFPTAHVQSVFARNGVIFEPREVSQGKAVTVRYLRRCWTPTSRSRTSARS